MKRLLAAVALSAVAAMAVVDTAEASQRSKTPTSQSFRRSRSRDVIVTQPSTGLDINTLLLLGALGGGSAGGGVGLMAAGAGGGLGILPLLLPQLLQPQQVIIHERRGRRR